MAPDQISQDVHPAPSPAGEQAPCAHDAPEQAPALGHASGGEHAIDTALGITELNAEPPAHEPLEALNAAQAQLDELRRAAQAAQEHASKLETRASDHAQALAEQAEHESVLRAEIEALQARLQEREGAIVTLAERLRQRAAPNDDGHAQPSEHGPGNDNATHAGRAHSDTAWAQLRRARLARMRSLLNLQFRKLIAARDALARRQEECESVLAQRAHLAERAAEITRQSELAERRAARGSGAVLAACACLVGALVGGLSWGIAGRVAPAIYAARAVVQAKGQVAQPPIEELRAWTQTHLELTTDPTVYTQAAENFVRRGMDNLSSPVSVEQRFREGLYVQADTPGTLTVELRGPGAERTTRELETFLSALMARSEAARGMRSDGLSAVIAQQPAAGSEPLSSERFVYALGMTAGGMLFAIVAGVGGYLFLRHSKTTFEVSQANAANA